MRGKILILSSSWNSEITYEMISGICERFEKEDLELHIMNIYDVMDPPGFYEKELELLSLPDPAKYDGVLVAINSVTSMGLMDEILSRYENGHTKILCVDRGYRDYARIGTDNYGAVYEITSHLIEQHGCNTFNFVGGPEKNEESQKRFAGFRDALRDHDIPLEPERVRFYHFLHRDGRKAYKDFKELGLHLPDAVVCGNDHMALGYCNAAGEDNYHAPEDFKITGFDNIYDARFFYPSITTVDRDWRRQGYDSADILLSMIYGGYDDHKEYVSGTIVKFNESCGCCPRRDYRQDFTNVFIQRVADENVRDIQRRIRRLLTAYSTEDQLPIVLDMCRNHMKLDDICLCLNKSFQGTYGPEGCVGYTDVMDAYTCTGKTEIRLADSLLPPSWKTDEGNGIYMFSPIHFGNRTYGYCVIPYSEGGWRLLDFRTYTESISTAMDSLHQKFELDAAHQRLREVYMKDGMTGLYNRSGYMRVAQEFYRKRKGRIFFVYFDMDNLKEMNDNYGHGTGDLAIKGIAEAITGVFPEGTINVRMGGDEFLVIGEYTSERDLTDSEHRIEDYLRDYASREGMALVPSVSMGHVVSDDEEDQTLEMMVNKADDHMYRIKCERKKQNNKTAR